MLASLLSVIVVLLTGVASAQTPVTLPPPQPVASSLPPLAATPSPEPITPVRYQYKPPKPGEDEKRTDYQIQVEPPGLDRFTRLDSDAKLMERIRQETFIRDPNERVEFPESPILSRDRYLGRGNVWPQRQLTVEPNFVYYHQLYFEDKNTERYGWELGVLQPVVSAAEFFFDLASLPMKIGNNICDDTETGAGYCLPGDPVPFLLYPPQITVPGTVAELGVIVVLMALFP